MINNSFPAGSVELKKLDKKGLGRAFSLLVDEIKSRNDYRSDKDVWTIYYGRNEAGRATMSHLKQGNDAITADLQRRYITQTLQELDLILVSDGKGGLALITVPEDISQLREWLNQDDTIHFVYYYNASQPVNNPKDEHTPETVRQAHLMLRTKSGQAALVFYDASLSKEANIFDPADFLINMAASFYYGRITSTKKDYYVSLEKRIHLKDSRHSEDLGLAVFQQSIENLMLGQKTIGTYTGVGPAAGMCVVERQLLAEVITSIRRQEIPSPITILLRDKIFSKRIDASQFDLKPAVSILKEVSRLEGTYHGFSYSSFSGQPGIAESYFKIGKGAHFSFMYPARTAEEQAIGPREGNFIELIHTNDESYLIAEACHYRRDKIDRLHLIFNLRMQRDNNQLPPGSLLVSYGGLSLINNKPIRGKLFLVRTENSNKNFRPKLHRATATNDMEQLLEKRPYLFSFINGKIDAERQRIQAEFKKVQRFWFSGPREKHLIEDNAGIYLSLRRSATMDVVYQRPFFLRRNTRKVTRFLRAIDSEQKIYKKQEGICQLIEPNVLQILLDQEVEEDKMFDPTVRSISRTTFLPVNRKVSNGNYLIGLTTRVNKAGRAVTYRELFFKVDQSKFKISDWIKDFHAEESANEWGALPELHQAIQTMFDQPDAYVMSVS